jgi:hypothetical protein
VRKIVVSAVLVVVLFCGCAPKLAEPKQSPTAAEPPAAAQTVEPIDYGDNKYAADSYSINTYNAEYPDALRAFYEFLTGERTVANGDDAEYALKYYRREGEPARNLRVPMRLIDINGDGQPELCFQCIPLYFFYYENGEINSAGTGWFATVLSNGAIFEHRHGAAPLHQNYAYTTYDIDWNILKDDHFSKFDMDEDGEYDTYYFNHDTYFQENDTEVTRAEFYALTWQYFDAVELSGGENYANYNWITAAEWVGLYEHEIGIT